MTVNVVDHGMNLQEAVTRPRLHHQWLPDTVEHEPDALPKDVLDALRRRGHRFAERARYIGDVQGVMVDPKTGDRLGTADPRSPDAAAEGY